MFNIMELIQIVLVATAIGGVVIGCFLGLGYAFIKIRDYHSKSDINEMIEIGMSFAVIALIAGIGFACGSFFTLR